MGVKDQGLQEYLKDNERFADFVNGTLFAGNKKEEFFLIDYIEGLEIKDEKRRHIYRLCRKRGFS